MYCKNCGAEFDNNANFCSSCGNNLKDIGQQASGDGSVNLAGNNTFDNSTIHVGDIYGAHNKDDTAYIDRTYVKEFKIAGNRVTTFWITFVGVIGFIGSVASIVSLWATYWQYIGLLAFIFSLLLFTVGRTLSTIRFFKLPITQYNLEANQEGLVYITQVGGDCPKCDGKLKLVDIKVGPDQYKTVVQCTRYKKHIWNFDPTVLK